MKQQNGSGELNITAHRARTSVWDRRGWDGTPEPLALSRWLVALGGGALVVEGLRRRTMSGATIAGLGGSLAWWALSGEGDLSDAQRWLAKLVDQLPWRQEDRVHESSADSFPASDAPAWTAHSEVRS